MKHNFIESYPLETQEKVKKHLVWLFVFSITMIFAGLTSAYIVSMGDNFWVKINLPIPFFVSTTLIIISSVLLYFATVLQKKGKISTARPLILGTLILGLGFGVFQFLGYKSLVNSGAHFVSSIIVSDGRYGDYFELKKDGEYLTVEDNQFFFKGEQMTGADKDEIQNFAKSIMVTSSHDLKQQKVDYSHYTLLYKGEPLALTNNEFIRPNGERLQELDYQRLYSFAQNIKDDRVDFFVKGQMGKDFKLFYNGNELNYQERTLMYKGKPLSANLQNKLLRGNSDKSTSYFYIITLLHLAHVLAAIIALISLTYKAYSIDNQDKLRIIIKANSIFWHFLGILWIYLLLFLVFIH